MSEKEKLRADELAARIAELERENIALLKVASHDVRSPLNKLFALLSLLRLSSDDLSDEQKGYIDKMEIVLSDGLSKMKNLMDLRAIEMGKIELFREQLNLGKLLTRIVSDHRINAQRKNISIDYKPIDAITFSDRLGFTRVLDQLLSNAVKFSPESSRIIVTLQDHEEEIIISVTDGGYGIGEHEQQELFKKFKPLTPRPTGAESTMGIGLFIAQENARLLSGVISYENKMKSVFRFRIKKFRLA